MILNNLNNFFLHFLEINNVPSEIIENWKSAKNQKQFIKEIKKMNITIVDPKKPKRGKSGFLYFCDENRNKVKEKNPNISVKQVVSKLGILWQELKKTNKSEIERFELMSLKDRNRYKDEMKSYIPILNRKLNENLIEEEIDDDEEIKTRKRKDYKRSSNPFKNYLRSKKIKTRKHHPEFDSEGVVNYLEQKWEKLPDKRKEKYVMKPQKSKDDTIYIGV